MKPLSTLSFFIALFAMAITTSHTTHAQQQYKLRQTTTMSGMKSESTIYVKGSRKRTEGGGYMGMTNPTTIEQCDLQRTIKINDKKKIYYIEPFAKDAEEIVEDDVKTAAVKTRPAPAQPKEKIKGGEIHMYYTITDTGERKKMFGIVARHVWTTQKMKPSADACMMKDSMIIKTDGWYIDLPQFNCPVNRYSQSASYGGGVKPDCQDRYINHRKGKGKLGFPLQEKRTMIMNNGMAQTSEYVTEIETLEFSTAKLDSMLFEIPLGYKQVTDEEELQDKISVADMMKQANYSSGENGNSKSITESRRTGPMIAVYPPTGEESLQNAQLQEHLVKTLTESGANAIAVSSESEAKKNNCELALSTEFTKVKQGSKVGSLLKAIKNTDPSATTSFNIEAKLTLINLSNGDTKVQEKVSGKFDGKADEAAKKALEKGSGQVLSELESNG